MKTKERIVTKKAEEKVAYRRLTVLQLAEELGNISEACKRLRMDRTSFYEWKRRFQTHGFEGLKDLPTTPKSHPNTTSDEVVEKILELSRKHPSWGCARISDCLKIEGMSVSGPTVQDFLNKNGMGTKYERLLKLEEEVWGKELPLTSEQIKGIEKMNPIFRERHIESSKPGELLAQDTLFIGTLKEVGKVYMQAVVDTYGSFAFGVLYVSKKPECSASILHNDVFPFYRKKGIKVENVLTDNGPEFCGNTYHPYEVYLELNDVKHRRTKVKSPQTNGFVERFNRTVLDEFFRIAFRKKYYPTLEDLQTDLDHWLHHYNYERTHRGYRNMGKRPIDTLLSFSK